MNSLLNVVVFENPERSAASQFLILMGLILAVVGVISVLYFIGKKIYQMLPKPITAKTKLILSLIAIALIVIIIVLIVNFDNRKDGFYFVEENDGTYWIKSYTGNDAYVEVPEKFKDKPVTRIGGEAFDGQNKIKTLIIPTSVTRIERGALQGCTSLVSLTIPFVGNTPEHGTLSCMFDPSVAIIEEETLKYIPKTLEKIYILDSCTKLKQPMFEGCSNLKEIHIPKSVVIIEVYTTSLFWGCSPSLQIYCETPEKPERWSERWNKGENGIEYNVHWGSK